MNCKPGELAFVIGSDFEEHIGLVCEVLRPAENQGDYGFEWVVRFPKLVRFSAVDDAGYEHGISMDVEGDMPDADLRPIRDNPGQDETLTWAPIEGREPIAVRETDDHGV